MNGVSLSCWRALRAVEVTAEVGLEHPLEALEGMGGSAFTKVPGREGSSSAQGPGSAACLSEVESLKTSGGRETQKG